MNAETMDTDKREHAVTASLPVTTIRPAHGWQVLNLRELWEHRELLYYLTWRDVLVRYKQAALGVAWAILQPLITMLVYTIIFSKLARVPSEGIPYPVFFYTAMLPWTFFSGAVGRAGTSLVSNANLLSKVYFPRLIIPTSAVAAGLVDFAISLLVFSGLMLWFHVPLRWAMLTLPFFILLAVVASLALGIWLAACNVRYRDVQAMVPFLLQILMYASPVVYSPAMVPAGVLRTVYSLNPLVGVIQGFRWALAGGKAPDAVMLFAATGLVLLLLFAGLCYFDRVESTFADVV